MTATIIPLVKSWKSCALLVPAGAGKDERHGLGRFAT
jgi:hypothetical protein